MMSANMVNVWLKKSKSMHVQENVFWIAVLDETVKCLSKCSLLIQHLWLKESEIHVWSISPMFVFCGAVLHLPGHPVCLWSCCWNLGLHAQRHGKLQADSTYWKIQLKIHSALNPKDQQQLYDDSISSPSSCWSCLCDINYRQTSVVWFCFYFFNSLISSHHECGIIHDQNNLTETPGCIFAFWNYLV